MSQIIINKTIETFSNLKKEIDSVHIEVLNYNFTKLFSKWLIIDKQVFITRSNQIYYYLIMSTINSDIIEIKYERTLFKKTVKGYLKINVNSDLVVDTLKVPEKQLIENNQILWVLY